MTTKDEALLALLHAIDIRCGSLPLAIEEAYTAYKKTPKQAQEPVKFLAKDEALRMALAALGKGEYHTRVLAHRLPAQIDSDYDADLKVIREAITAIKQAQQAQEPVEPLFYYRPTCNGEMYEGPHHAKSIGGRMLREEKPGEWVGLYTHPAPQRQPLTDAAPDLLAALKDAVDRQAYQEGRGPEWWENARAAIAKATGGAA